MTDFIHLHTHSHYSLLNALPTIKELVAAAKANGMPAVALTDNGNMYGGIHFYKECVANDVKPIMGVDSYVAPRTRHDKEARIDNRWSRLVLLAETNEGYQNLMKLVTKSFMEGFYYKPRVDHELLEEYCKGLVAILPSFSAESSKALKKDDIKEAEEKISWYKKTFGDKNVYLEITHHPEVDGHSKLIEQIIGLGKKTGTPLVAAHDVYYINPDDRTARETLVKIQTSGVMETDTYRNEKEDFSFISQEKAKEYFREHPDALKNSVEIAERCNVELELGKWIFPDLKVESGRSYDEELKVNTYEGLRKLGIEETPEVVDRIEYELKVIKDKGFSPYFLVVADLINYARENSILTNTRGSAAGSIVSYCVGITNINPLEYQLPFERFLNPERPKAPDIDMDFADDRRDEVIEYARRKHGEDHVAQIGTFGTMLARAVVRDVARSMGYPYALGDSIAKTIPMGMQGFPMTIERAMDESPDFKKLYQSNADVKKVVDLAKKLEGHSRHISVHAAGVMIAPKPLVEYTPLQYDPKGTDRVITQYDMYSISDEYGGVGLLKFDFLGIKNLSILANAVRRVKKIHNIDIDIENIPIDDKKTFQMLARGETMGLFQLGGSGMTRYLKELKPTTIHDINAMVALFRPGPMESIPQYIERKQNPHLVSFFDERMRDLLERSYGLLVYQEDVLLTAITLAGYSWLEADQLRKAMGKKKPEEMEAQKIKFTTGCKERGVSEDKALHIWKLIEPFAAYGFGKAHAASYGRVAYQTAYMKANFTPEYMASVLSADAGNVEKVAEAINECVRLGIQVYPPDVNESFGEFSVHEENGKPYIRFGLFSIKNFGEGIAESIVEERKTHGKFKSITDFLERINDRNLNKKSLEALVKAGALDSFEDRGVLFYNLENLLAFAKESANKHEAQDSLFGSLPDAEDPALFLDRSAEPPSQEEQLTWEKELLGLYISGHPLDKYRDRLTQHDMSIERVKKEIREGMPVVIYGIIEASRPIVTKKGDTMSFIQVSDYTGSIEAVVFPKMYQEHQETLQSDSVIGLKGRVSDRNGERSLVVERIKKLS